MFALQNSSWSTLCVGADGSLKPGDALFDLADLNGDGVVDFADLSEALSNYGNGR